MGIETENKVPDYGAEHDALIDLGVDATSPEDIKALQELREGLASNEAARKVLHDAVEKALKDDRDNATAGLEDYYNQNPDAHPRGYSEESTDEEAEPKDGEEVTDNENE